MPSIVGVRAEDKNRWERRAPLTPDHVAELTRTHRVTVRVQPSSRRAFSDLDYERAGADLALDLTPCGVILGVKEVPVEKLLHRKTYMFFSHVTKGQACNMGMLRRLLELECTLIDYEPIVDRRGRRIIFFGRHAGYAGMIDSLWALGQRLSWEGFATPFHEVRLAHQYSSLDEATRLITAVGDQIRRIGLPVGLRPVVFAFAGSGNVSQGAQEIFDRLPYTEIGAEDLRDLEEDRDRPRNAVFKTVIDRAQRADLTPLLPHITVFINGIFWEPGQPRLITIDQLRSLWRDDPQPKLRVIGDITCDIGGSIEATLKTTEPGDPVFVYEVESGAARPGWAGRGPVLMAVDNLPCELPVEASQHFGDSLLRFIPSLARCDWSLPLEQLDVPEEMRRAIIVHRGELTPRYRYLEEPVRTAG
ncbi:MAG TPA: bifunctional lysine ketoglutarate reductase /saccharopine dehydrogenase family protein [Thermoanaerobaculia bacterium]|nr:bifunctional lysine ketoglutarate reductase /saccharopine dehydrogenase family protein [Thermoanaerobaculia bacterium]